jgi:glycine oxidase
VETADVVIAGAGIIGLSAALELARNGLRVAVAERGRAMTEASWAAAGMLAGGDPENPAALAPLSQLSLKLYPEFLARIEQLSGGKVPIRTRVALQGTRPGRRFSDTEAGAGRRLSPVEVAGYASALNGSGRDFLLLDEWSLDPRDLCAALPLAAAKAGVALREETDVLAVSRDSAGIEVSTSRGPLSAGAFVNCCGAWAGQLAAAAAEASAIERLGLEPRKGQIVTVRLKGPAMLNVVVRTPETYLVPRGDGRVVIGATVERTGFDKAIHAEVVRTLVNEAADLWTPIREAEVVDTWAGLRPGSSDGLPALGRFGEPGCWMATGHFRNGILLAPATARVLTEMILGRDPQVDLGPFACDRFAAVS